MKLSRYIGINLLVVVALFSACGGNQIREARKAAYRVQIITDAAIDTTATLFHDGVLTKEKTNEIARALLKELA